MLENVALPISLICAYYRNSIKTSNFLHNIVFHEFVNKQQKSTIIIMCWPCYIVQKFLYNSGKSGLCYLQFL